MTTDRFITGIFNYCDYWCERCAFTRRCRNYASGRAERGQTQPGDEVSPPDSDATNAAFWDTLAEQLREISIVGNPESDALVPPDDALDPEDGPDDTWLEQQEKRCEEAKRHPLMILSRNYMMKVHDWIQTADSDLKVVARGMLEDAANPFVKDDVEQQAREIGEMIDVVAWHHTLIPAKLGRAVHGILERGEEEGEYAAIIDESRCSDANGSGKVALTAVERSIAAWLKLRDILPAKEDCILAMLAMLDRIRRRIQIDLPDSVTFRRPGFDGDDVGLFD